MYEEVSAEAGGGKAFLLPGRYSQSYSGQEARGLTSWLLCVCLFSSVRRPPRIHSFRGRVLNTHSSPESPERWATECGRALLLLSSLAQRGRQTRRVCK